MIYKPESFELKPLESSFGVKFSNDIFLMKSFLDQNNIEYNENELDDSPLGRGVRIKREKNMNYPKPFGERILVKREKIETKSGIIITEKASKNEGEVVAIGCDTKDKPMKLSVGYKVLFSGYGTTIVNIEEDKDNQYLLMNQNDVLAILS